MLIEWWFGLIDLGFPGKRSYFEPRAKCSGRIPYSRFRRDQKRLAQCATVLRPVLILQRCNNQLFACFLGTPEMPVHTGFQIDAVHSGSLFLQSVPQSFRFLLFTGLPH
jgi:hypothetical protein